jgi:ATP-dependent DNA ligase
MNLNEFFNDLAANNSRNYKLDKLKEHANDEVLRLVISLALDPFTNFYQRKIPEYTRQRQTIPMRDVFPFLYQMCNRLVTGNAAIAHLSTLLGSVTEDNAEVIKRIVTKDLKCGVSISTANVVWPGLIKEYPVMLCSAYEQKLVDKIKFPAYAQLKMDGMRFNAIVKNDTCEFRSRNGKEILLDTDLKEQFITIAAGSDMVFDGELMVMDPDGCQFLDRQTGNGILNKAVKGTISAKEADMVHASVWDAIPYVLFEDSYCDTPYSRRFTKLKAILDVVPFKTEKKIWLVTSNIVNTLEEATEIFEEYLAEGLEGIILKDGSGVWEDKRAKHQIKFKGELECDLKIVGTEPHKKKPDWLGAIICESADGIIKVNVGSGFNDTHRKTLKEKDVLGKIVAIKYNARIKSKSGEESLFLPVFVEIREDKNSADSSKEVK